MKMTSNTMRIIQTYDLTTSSLVHLIMHTRPLFFFHTDVQPLGTDPQTGQIDPELKRMALEEYKGQFGLRGN